MKIKKELWFGFIIMGLLLMGTAIMMPNPANWHNGHLGLLMLSLVVVAIMLGFPTAFTLMGMGMLFTYLAYRGQPGAMDKALQLMVQRTYSVMTNDVLISIPLFVFMGYLVERANLIEKLFKSLHLSLARVPGSLAVATLVTCAIFATATGIVGAVVTLMGLLALPSMLRAGYDIKLSAGAITAGGCLGILIPPSVMLIVYGATAGVSVVQLYAGAFFPGIMLAGLYIGYVVIRAKLNPKLAPPLSEEDRRVPLPVFAEKISAAGNSNAFTGLLAAVQGKIATGEPHAVLTRNFLAVLLPIATFVAAGAVIWHFTTAPAVVESTAGLQEMGGALPSGVEAPTEKAAEKSADSGLQELPKDTGLQEPPKDTGGIQEPPKDSGVQEPPKDLGAAVPPKEVAAAPVAAPAAPPVGTTKAATPAAASAKPAAPVAADAARLPTPTWFYVVFGVGLALVLAFYKFFNFARLEIFKLLLGSFFPLAVLILFVLGSIVFGLATPTEAAAIGSFGGALLALAYGRLTLGVVRESSFLTAKTSAMVCWLFVGSSIFSAAFALLGGQELIEKWVISLGLTKVQFLILSQFIIFILGWPLEWTEIIVIFMPIFIPLLAHFQIDPLFFGLLVALNLQTAFLSPPVAMAAFYLKGVSPPHVTLNQIFAGMVPFMMIQVFALTLLYIFPQIGLWLPSVLYK